MTTVPRRRFLGLLGAAGAALLAAPFPASARKARIVRIVARKFEFEPRDIRLKAGEPMVLELTALDFVHGFNVPGLKLRTDLMPGQVTRLAFTAPAAGTLPFLCDNFCGSGHEEMNGRFIVES